MNPKTSNNSGLTSNAISVGPATIDVESGDTPSAEKRESLHQQALSTTNSIKNEGISNEKTESMTTYAPQLLDQEASNEVGYSQTDAQPRVPIVAAPTQATNIDVACDCPVQVHASEFEKKPNSRKRKKSFAIEGLDFNASLETGEGTTITISPPLDGPPHSIAYLYQKLNSMDWSMGVTKHLQQYMGFLIAAGAAIPIDTAIKIIVARLEAADAVIDPQAVRRQAERAYEYVNQEPAHASHAEILARKLPKPTFDLQTLQESVADTPEVTEQELRDRSFVWPNTSSEFLELLYQPGERIAVFDDMLVCRPKAVWQHGVELGEPEGQGVWFLCNPIDGQRYPNPRNGGKMSMRSEESITSFRYAVLECDHEKEYPGVNALWLKYLVRLPLPISAIYTSGGKSIHALVRVDACSKKDWDAKRDQLLRECVIFGADPSALTAVRLTRLPYSRNLKYGTMQRLLFVNPNPTGKAIYER